MIERNNYEAFFLDYYEGNLSPAQVKELYSFLDANPDLRIEFEEYEYVSLKDVEDELLGQKEYFIDKDILKKEKITADNVDEYIILFNDNVLKEKDCEELERFLKKNPTFASLKNEYKKTILQPDTSIAFNSKFSLKKNALEINADNEEEVLIEYSEGLMNDLHSASFEKHLKTSPNLIKELKKYETVKLVADHSIIFRDKQALYNIPKKKQRILFYFITAAAGLMLLFFSYWIMNNSENINEQRQYSSGITPTTSGTEANKSAQTKNNSVNEIEKKKQIKAVRIKINELEKITEPPIAVITNDTSSNGVLNSVTIIAVVKEVSADTSGHIILSTHSDKGVVVYNDAKEKENIESPNEYLSIKAFLLKRIRASSGVKNPNPDCAGKRNKLTVSDVIALGTALIKKAGGKDVEVVTKENACGDAIAVIVRTNGWEFERSLLK
jgi:hypothetical protein